MIFAQFYELSTGYPTFKEEDKKPVEACGDRGVVILDGRSSITTLKAIARAVAKQRGYTGFRLERGPSLLRAKPVTDYQAI